MWLVAIAAAAEPTLVVTDAGTIRGTVFVGAAPDRVKALLLDPDQRLATVSGEGTRSTTEVDGACVLEHSDVPHPIRAVSYTVRSCPTATGVRSELVRSDDLTRLTSVWTVEVAEGGSRVTYELDAVPSFPLPSFVARASAKGGVYDALAAVARRFGS
ncbi:MAG: hypothetical protein ABMA64_33570 [Myxococcota bacterium]